MMTSNSYGASRRIRKQQTATVDSSIRNSNEGDDQKKAFDSWTENVLSSYRCVTHTVVKGTRYVYTKSTCFSFFMQSGCDGVTGDGRHKPVKPLVRFGCEYTL